MPNVAFCFHSLILKWETEHRQVAQQRKNGCPSERVEKIPFLSFEFLRSQIYQRHKNTALCKGGLNTGTLVNWSPNTAQLNIRL